MFSYGCNVISWDMINKYNLIEELRELERSGFISYEEMEIWIKNIQRHLMSCGDNKNKISYHTTSLPMVVM